MEEGVERERRWVGIGGGAAESGEEGEGLGRVSLGDGGWLEWRWQEWKKLIEKKSVSDRL